MTLKKLYAIILLILLFTISCSTITKDMWNEHYYENFKRFLITQDGGQIIFLGEDFHYILFDQVGVVKAILFSKYRYLLLIDTENSYMELDKNNNIEAYIAIKLTTFNPPPEAVAYFSSLGFSRYRNQPLFLKLKLPGKRYGAPDKMATYAHALQNSYVIEVKYVLTDADKIERAAITPITITVDAILSIGNIILLPFSAN